MNTLKDIISMGGGLFDEAYNTGRRDALRETGAEEPPEGWAQLDEDVPF